MANTSNLTWETSSPALTDLRSTGALEIKSLREAVEERINKEHETLVVMTGTPGTPDLNTGGCEHKLGSAKAYYEVSPGPTSRPDGATALHATEDLGRLWVNSTSKAIFVWTGTAWTAASFNAESFGTDIFSSMKDGTGWTNGTGALALVTWFALITSQVQNLIQVEDSGSVFRSVSGGLAVSDILYYFGSALVPNGKKIRWATAFGGTGAAYYSTIS